MPSASSCLLHVFCFAEYPYQTESKRDKNWRRFFWNICDFWEEESTRDDARGTFASQKEIVVSQIDKLGGEVDESLGIGQEIGSLFSKLKDALITDDEEVLENAVKAMDMGVKQGDKVIGKIEASDANRDIIETLNHMVNEYREISVFLMKLHKGNW